MILNVSEILATLVAILGPLAVYYGIRALLAGRREKEHGE